MVAVTCETCGKQFNKKASHAAKSARHFCSLECYYSIGRVTVVCDHCGSSVVKKVSDVCNLAHSFCSEKCYWEYKRSASIGPLNPNWRDGLGAERSRQRCLSRDGKWKRWADAVKDRDGRRCVRCGETKSIHAHHIQEWETAPDLRYELQNGETLCAGCHMAEHSKRGWFVSVTR